MRWRVLVGFLGAASGLTLACGDNSGPGLRLEVNPKTVQLTRNDSLTLSVTPLDADDHLVIGISVTFSSADTTIASVTNLGVVHSHASVGSTTITVEGGGAGTQVPVTVIATPATIVIAPGDTSVRPTTLVAYRAVVLDEAGDTIPNATVSWQSTDTTIATITANGTARAKSKHGNTTIIGRIGVHVAGASLHVIVPGFVTEVTVSPTDTAIPSGAFVQLSAAARDGWGDPVPGAAIAWTSESPLLATVSGTGRVHSLGPSGTAVVRATSGTVFATVPIVVLDSLLSGRTKVPDAAYAAAVSAAGVAYVSQSFSSRVLRANLPSQTFGQSVTVGTEPTEMAFNSSGTRLYVTNQSSSTISVINVAANTRIDSIVVGNRPFEVIVAPGDSILYVGKVDSVYGIRLSSKAIIVRFPIPEVGNGIAIARDTLLYVSTHDAGTVVEFNIRTRTLGRTFSVGGIPQKLVVSPDGNTLYIANESGYLQFWDLNTGLQDGTNLTLPSAAYGLARRPTNGLLYVTSAYFGGGYIYVVDPIARTIVYSAVVGGSTRHVVFTPDGSIGIVPNENHWVDFLR